MIYNIETKEQLAPFLMAMLGSQELVNMWWHSQNSALRFKSPSETWGLNSAKVISYVLDMYQRSGGS